MADAQPATDALGNLDIASMLAKALPQDNVDVPKAQEGLKKVATEQAKETSAISDRMTRNIEADRSEMMRARQGIEPIPDTKWDADKERQKYATDPMKEFGSFGFIALTLASAFTRQPMINMMNAAGSYLQAANDRNSKDYERAYEAFKDNHKIAMDRHNAEREAYDDAMKLLTTDVSAGKAEFAAVAAKFGDKRAQVLADAGMDDKLVEYLDAKQKAYAGVARMMPMIEEQHMKRQLLQLDPDYNSPDPARKQAALRRVMEGRLDPQQQIYDQWVKEHPESDAETRADFYKDLKTIKPQSGQQIALERFLEEHPDATSDQIRDFTQTMGKAAGGPSANRSVENKAVDEIIAKDKEKGVQTTYAEALKRFREETSKLPEGEKNKIRQRIDAFDNSSDKIDSALSVLDRTVGSAGLAGRVTRLGERVGNILGSNSTDREQFMRDIQYLRMAGTRLLTESAGRPIAAEASRINDIIGGIDLGDTTANTIRALEEVKQLYAKMRTDNIARLKGTWAPRGETPASGEHAAPPSASGNAPWLNDPVVK